MWKTKPNSDDSPSVDSMQCPVCKTKLGKRDRSTIFIARCEECRATFTWQPKEVKPAVIMDKDIRRVRRYCDKNGCYCHS